MLDTLIVGAGISGLSLARTLQKKQHQILVAECQERVGGNITTVRAGEFCWEEGPNSFSPTPELLKLAVDVGLKEQLVLADRRLPRYIYWQGQLHPVPMSPNAAIATQLLSPTGKLRALLGSLGFVPPPVGQQLGEQGGEETVAQFFQRHLGAEVTERLVAPFVSGVYAGDVNQLSARAAFRRIVQLTDAGGGLLAGAMLSRLQAPRSQTNADPDLPPTQRGELGSFTHGLQMLPEAIASHLGNAVKLNWRLTQLRPTQEQTYIAEFATPDGHQQIEARTIVLTPPAYVSAELLAPLQSNVSAALSNIPYPTVACVVLAYPEAALKRPLDGFGNLIPRGQGIRTLGTIWSSTLFPGRAPQGWHLLTNFIGGATDPEITTLDEAQLVQAVHHDLLQVLLKQDLYPKVLAVHRWRRAIPQYTLAHQARCQQIEQGLTQLPGLYLCGNYFDGVSLGDCVRRSFEQAETIDQYLGAIATKTS